MKRNHEKAKTVKSTLRKFTPWSIQENGCKIVLRHYICIHRTIQNVFPDNRLQNPVTEIDKN